MIQYEDYVDKYQDNFVQVELDDSTVTKVKNFVSDIIEVKKDERHHVIDSGMEEKRWTTGYLGECAVEKFIGVNFVDFSIGDSTKYHVADLKFLGIDCGIKTVEKGKFPIIFKKSYKPEIIVIKKSEKLFDICGLATKEVLNKYQSIDLVLSPYLKNRGTKTGFYGFNKLIHPEKFLLRIQQLQEIANG